MNPHDKEAEVTKMKDGSTHFAYTVEQAVDLETGAIVAITTQGGAVGDTTSVQETLPEAGVAVAEQIATPTAKGQYKVHDQGTCEVVTDKGYHSGPGLAAMQEMGLRTYVSVPHRLRRKRDGKAEQQAALNANQRRVEGQTGQEFVAAAGRISGAALRASIMRPAGCEGYMCGAREMWPSECSFKPRPVIWR